MSERAIRPTEPERDRQRRALRGLREASGMGQTEAAAKMGFSAAQLSRYESGRNLLPSNYYAPIASAYGISKENLIIRLLAESPLDAMLATLGLSCDERKQLITSIGSDPLSDEERLALLEFCTSMLNKRRAHPPDCRRRA